MRKPDGKYKLAGYSLKEIRGVFERELQRVRELDVQATDQAMARAHLVNAVFLWYFGQPEVDRDRIVRAGTEEFRKLLDLDDPVPLVLPDGVSVAPEPTRGRGLGGVTVETEQREPKRLNARKVNDH